MFWEPPQRVGMKRNKDWLSKAVAASVAHPRNLKTSEGIGHLSGKCVCLYSLGTANLVLASVDWLDFGVLSSDSKEIETCQ